MDKIKIYFLCRLTYFTQVCIFYIHAIDILDYREYNNIRDTRYSRIFGTGGTPCRERNSKHSRSRCFIFSCF